MKILQILNRQKTARVQIPLLEEFTALILHRLRVPEFELGIHLVGPSKMAEVNQQYLNHQGATDVITFDHGSSRTFVRGELFICVAVAMSQAREFQTIWQAELLRYIVHGILHLLGFDDLDSASRRVMKRRENSIMRHLQKRLDLVALGYG